MRELHSRGRFTADPIAFKSVHSRPQTPGVDDVLLYHLLRPNIPVMVAWPRLFMWM